MNLEASHKEIRNIENIVAQQVQGDLEMFIHSDPCVVEYSCKICSLENCTYRKAEKVKKLEWSLENLLPNRKHTA
jgi:hypothetical protein